MSVPQGAEISLAYADFLSTRVDNLTDIRWGPAYSTGTRLLARDARGVWRAYLISDLTAPLKPVPTSQVFTVTLSRTTASFPKVSSGYGGPVTPTTTGSLFIYVTATMRNDTAGDGFGIGVFYNLTGVPVNGTLVGTDTSALCNQNITEGTANQLNNITSGNILTGLTVGTTYYFYIGFNAITGGNATLSGSLNTKLIIVELPLS